MIFTGYFLKKLIIQRPRYYAPTNNTCRPDNWTEYKRFNTLCLPIGTVTSTTVFCVETGLRPAIATLLKVVVRNISANAQSPGEYLAKLHHASWSISLILLHIDNTAGSDLTNCFPLCSGGGHWGTAKYHIFNNSFGVSISCATVLHTENISLSKNATCLEDQSSSNTATIKKAKKSPSIIYVWKSLLLFITMETIQTEPS